MASYLYSVSAVLSYDSHSLKERAIGAKKVKALVPFNHQGGRKMFKNFKTKVLSFALTIAMVATSGSFAFATIPDESKEEKNNNLAETIEATTGIHDTERRFNETPKGFVFDKAGTKIIVPKEDTGKLTIKSNATKSVGMMLPIENSEKDVTLTNKGTVIYGDSDSNLNVGVQVVGRNFNGMSYETVMTSLVIKSNDAAKEYPFKYDLPKGYKLITSEEYIKKYATKGEIRDKEKNGGYEEEIYVINEKGRIVEAIDPVWAKDANGNDVRVRSKVENNKLVQVLAFNKNTKFPVVTVLNSHPNKKEHRYISKKVAKAILNAWETSDSETIHTSIAGVGLVFCGTIGSVAAVHMGAYAAVLAMQRKTLRKYVNSMSKSSKLRMTYYYRWRNGGKNSGYYLYDTAYKIV